MFAQRWQKYFTILGSKERDIINGAMEEWKQYTCIDFKKATSNTETYIKYENGEG